VTDAEYLQHIKQTYQNICGYTSGDAKKYIGFLLGLLEKNEGGFCYVGWLGAAFDVLKEEVRQWIKDLIRRKR
jgi:ATP-dependent DNA ligase